MKTYNLMLICFFNVLVKEFQGLGLKVDLLDHGESNDANDIIEQTSREIEQSQDDEAIYAAAQTEARNIQEGDLVDLDEEEIQTIEADFAEEDEDNNDGLVDLGEEN